MSAETAAAAAERARRAAAARFFRAAERGELSTLRALAAERPELVRLDRAEDDEHTALHYAVLNRDAACTRFLLEAGADPHKGIYPHREATSPLTLAEERGFEDIAALIRDELARRAVRAGADPQRGDELFDLVRGGDLDGVRRLLDCAVLSFGWTQRDRAGATWGRQVITEDERGAFAALLLDAGADLTRRDPLLRSTPLGWACRWGRYELARLLIERGAAADEPDAAPWAAPLAWAAKMGHDRLAALLRRHGAQRSG